MCFENYKSTLYDFFEKQKYCDVTFSFSDPTSANGKSTIVAHKLILSLASNVFNMMFNEEATKEVNFNDNPIKIDDIQISTFRLLLR